MKKRLIIGLASVGLVARLSAQFPAAPAAGAAGALAGPPGIAPGPAAPAPGGTLWGFLGISKEQKEYCLRKLCKTPLGSLLANGTAPLQALSGGLIGPFCPQTPTLAELADEGVVGDAAKIKLDEAKAKERRAAVRYLGTVDCHYWPEAEEGLVGALRGDRNECVRFEAALALGRGCCCTKKTIEALTIVVSCSDRDGAPKETSQRVHAAAHAALAHCLACYVEIKPEEKKEPPKPEGEARPEEPPPVVPPVVPAATKATSPGEAKPSGLVLGEAKPIRDMVLGEAKLIGRVIPGEAKPGPGQRVAATEATSTRPTGFAYYARIAQVPLLPILTEARRVSVAHAPNRPLLPGDRSVVKLVNYATTPPAAPGAAPATPLAAAEESDALADRPANLWDMLVRPSPSPVPAPKPATPAPPPPAALVLPLPALPAPTPPPPVAAAPTPPAPVTAAPAMATPVAAAPVLPLPAFPAPTPPAPGVAVPTPPAPAMAAPKPAIVVPVYSPTSTAVSPTPVPAVPVPPAPQPPTAEPTLPQPTVIIVPTQPVEPPPAMTTRGVAEESLSAARRVLAAKGNPAQRTATLDAVEAADVRSCPELTDALMRAARDGATAEVRIAGLRALARAQVYEPAVFTLMQRLAEDPSPAVRSVAVTSLARLRVGLGQ